jgi:hypothetical protein
MRRGVEGNTDGLGCRGGGICRRPLRLLASEDQPQLRRLQRIIDDLRKSLWPTPRDERRASLAGAGARKGNALRPVLKLLLSIETDNPFLCNEPTLAAGFPAHVCRLHPSGRNGSKPDTRAGSNDHDCLFDTPATKLARDRRRFTSAIAIGVSKAIAHSLPLDHTTSPRARTVPALNSSASPSARRLTSLSFAPVREISLSVAVCVSASVDSSTINGACARGAARRPPCEDLPKLVMSAETLPMPHPPIGLPKVHRDQTANVGNGRFIVFGVELANTHDVAA